MSFFFSSRRRHTRCALVTGVQTCALPIFVLADQEWRIEETFRLLYADSSLVIDGFSLRNNGQALSINGAVSKSDSLPLNIEFTNLDIAALDPLTRQYNLALGGIMNGEIGRTNV